MKKFYTDAWKKYKFRLETFVDNCCPSTYLRAALTQSLMPGITDASSVEMDPIGQSKQKNHQILILQSLCLQLLELSSNISHCKLFIVISSKLTHQTDFKSILTRIWLRVINICLLTLVDKYYDQLTIKCNSPSANSKAANNNHMKNSTRNILIALSYFQYISWHRLSTHYPSIPSLPPPPWSKKYTESSQSWSLSTISSAPSHMQYLPFLSTGCSPRRGSGSATISQRLWWLLESGYGLRYQQMVRIYVF